MVPGARTMTSSTTHLDMLNNIDAILFVLREECVLEMVGVKYDEILGCNVLQTDELCSTFGGASSIKR